MTVEEVAPLSRIRWKMPILTESKEHTSPMATRSRIGIELQDDWILSVRLSSRGMVMGFGWESISFRELQYEGESVCSRTD